MYPCFLCHPYIRHLKKNFIYTCLLSFSLLHSHAWCVPISINSLCVYCLRLFVIVHMFLHNIAYMKSTEV